MHALIRHYLTTRRKYALIKKYALNRHVRLLTRLYGNVVLVNPWRTWKGYGNRIKGMEMSGIGDVYIHGMMDIHSCLAS